jgi:hypothetical protein
MQPWNHDNRFDGIRKKEIASFRGRAPQKLAISNALSRENRNPAQRLGWFFTGDSFALAVQEISIV